MPEISDRLRGEREAMGLSQQAMAELSGITARSQRNYESGERLPDAAYLAAIAKAGADVVYVLTGQRDGSVPTLDAAERVLLDSYRRCQPEARAHLIKTGALLSAGLGVDGTSQGAVTQLITAPVWGGVAGRDINRNKAKKS